MKKKAQKQYVCRECGDVSPKWTGKCDSCGEWNTLEEFRPAATNSPFVKSASAAIGRGAMEVTSLGAPIADISRVATNISELDRTLGGGLVLASAVLIGGNPGIGKSTLLLQVMASLANQGHHCLYVSGEESVEQIKLRAHRLGLEKSPVTLGSATVLKDIMAVMEEPDHPNYVVIDSIQTLYHDEIPSAPGTVTQVRACTFELIRIAKQKGITLIIIGHVTKDGQLAGPKVLEHMVDTVLYFEGDKGSYFRMVRAIKNRFGPANEIGIFQMLEAGLKEVENPSEMFLPNRDDNISGSCVFAGIEGTRPMLLEIQALVVPSFLATPRRAVVGWDANRLAMLIAVLKARYDINLLDKEVYLNVTGGLKVAEPAVDLAVIAALISAARNRPIAKDIVFFGEVGLSGEVRQVLDMESRLREAHKLGFKTAVIPHDNKIKDCKIDQIRVNHISELKNLIG
jgi:DNA repair protein RadA/Sms